MTTAPQGANSAAATVMRLRYRGACDTCGTELVPGTQAAYLRTTKAVRCLNCFNGVGEPTAAPPTSDGTRTVVDPGTAGSAAWREYDRRVARRDARIRTAHPRLGGLILALSDEPRSTTAWARGARGEAMLGARLDGLAPNGVRVLHDRRIPGSRANIDHIAVTPTGVYVIDTKRYRGRVSLRVRGGLLRPRAGRLMVDSRDRTSLVHGVLKQVDLVGAALDAAGLSDVPAGGVLRFVEAEWPPIGGDFLLGSVMVAWPRKVARILTAPGPLTTSDVERTHRALAQAFPVA